MTKAHKQANKTASDFFRMIVEETDHFPVEVIEILGKKDVQGVVALDTSLSDARKAELLQLASSLSSRSNSPTIALLDKQTGLPGKAGFISQSDAEIDLVQKSRLPCSLLLIELSAKKGNNILKKASSLIKKETPHYLARFDTSTLALLLPGINKNRAVKKAHALYKELTIQPESATVSIGLATCLARNIITTDDFIQMASEQLERAKKEGAGVFHASGELADDSCQVTTEERTHLFRFLRG